MKKLRSVILLVLMLSVTSVFGQLLSEDFESGNFPPPGWDNPGGWGSVVWSDFFGISGFGIGDNSAFYDGYYWDGDVDSMITAEFSQTFGESLIFDHAYAPYDDGKKDYYSDLQIYVKYDGDDEWYYFETIPGTTLQTSPGTDGFFQPLPSEWSTYSVELPWSTVRVAFVCDNFNSNNLFIDNVRIDYPPTGSDMAVQSVYAKGRFPRPYLANDTISASIKNMGATPFNNFYVHLSLSGANNYNDSVLVSFLGSNQEMTVNFAPYNPVMNGHTQVRVWVEPDDETSNDEAFYDMQVGSRFLSYNDTTENYCCGIGWFGEGYWLSKYRITDANTRIKSVNVRIIGVPGSTGQLVRGVILNSSGVMIAKSDAYKIKANDNDKMVNLKLTDPIPHKVASANSTFYVGIEQNAISSATDDAYAIQGGQNENPLREGSYFASVGLYPVGSVAGLFETPWGNRYGIEAEVVPISSTDVGISNLGLLNEQYFTTATIQPKGRVYNNATSGSANATVIRKITPGGYTSSQNVSIPANSSVEVTFSNWNFTSGTEYTVRDSIVLAGDTDLSDNVRSGIITPRVAKQLAVFWQKGDDKDSLVRAIQLDGRFASNYDVVPMNYTGSYRPWKYIFMNIRRVGNWNSATRDSMKSFLDASTAGNKKSLVMFSNTVAQINDPIPTFFVNPADSIFLRQYMKAKFLMSDWQNSLPAGRKFKGRLAFSGISQDSLDDNTDAGIHPDLVSPVNGGFAALLPVSVTGTPNDSAIAVAFAGTNYNTFLMTNQFSALRSSSSSPLDGPVLVYQKIIDWITGTTSTAKVMDLNMFIEGFYDPNSDLTVRDTVRVYLRSTSSPYPVIDSAKGYLGTDGTVSLSFFNAANNVSYYIQIKHRNAIETWSRTGSSFSSGFMTYDFTSDSAKAFGFNMVEMGSKWVFYGGDVNQDGFIDGTDNTLIDNDAFNFAGGYVVTDLNGDEFVDATDFAIADNNAYNFIGRITPNSEPQFVSGESTTSTGTVNDQSASSISIETKIDHEIYERFKNNPQKYQSVKTLKKGNETLMMIE